MYLFAFLLAQDQREADGMQWFNYILERMKKRWKPLWIDLNFSRKLSVCSEISKL